MHEANKTAYFCQQTVLTLLLLRNSGNASAKITSLLDRTLMNSQLAPMSRLTSLHSQLKFKENLLLLSPKCIRKTLKPSLLFPPKNHSGSWTSSVCKLKHLDTALKNASSLKLSALKTSFKLFGIVIFASVASRLVMVRWAVTNPVQNVNVAITICCTTIVVSENFKSKHLVINQSKLKTS